MYKYHTHVFLDHVIMQGSLTSASNTALPHRLRPKGNSYIKAISEADTRYNNTVDFGYSGHRYRDNLDIVATLARTESFTIISSLNKTLIVATHFGYIGHFTCIFILKAWISYFEK